MRLQIQRCLWTDSPNARSPDAETGESPLSPSEETVVLLAQNQFSSAVLKGLSVKHLKSDFGDRRDQSPPNAQIRALQEEPPHLERRQRIQKGNGPLR